MPNPENQDESIAGDDFTKLPCGVSKLPTNSSKPKSAGLKANIYSSKIKEFRMRRRHIGKYVKCSTLSDDEDAPDSIPVSTREEPVRMLRPRPEPLVDLTVSVQDLTHGEDWTPPRPAVFKSAAKKNRKQTTKILRELEAAKKQLSKHTIKKEDNDVCIIHDEEPSIDRDILVKMRWQGSIHRIPMKQNQKFQTVYPTLASTCGALPSEIVLSFSDANIRPDDTPASLRMTVADILDCGVLKLDSAADDVLSESDARTVRLKVQAVDRKSKAVIRTNKFDPLSTLMEKYARMQGLNVENLAFSFDGDRLDPELTPADLDMEDDDCIDVRSPRPK